MRRWSRGNWVLAGVAVTFLVVAYLVVAIFFAPKWAAADVTSSKPEAQATARASERGSVRTAMLAVLAGGIAAVGAVYTGRTFALNQRGQLTERFTRAVDQLGAADKLDVRLGGIYALERLADESDEEYGPIIEILCAYVRSHAPAGPQPGWAATALADRSAARTLLDESAGAVREAVGRAGALRSALITWGNKLGTEGGVDEMAAFHGAGRQADLLNARVQIMFGKGSPVADAYADCLIAINRIARGANMIRGIGDQDYREYVEDVNEGFTAAEAAHEVLLAAGHEAIGGAGPDREEAPVDIQAVMTVLARRSEDDDNRVRLDLRGTDLRFVRVAGLRAESANLMGADLRGAVLNGADLQEARLDGADLQEAHLDSANLQKAVLDFANLQRASLDNANLQDALLTGADLQGAALYDANLQEALLNGADLQVASLNGANLDGAVLSGADLQGASLPYANLRGAVLNGADLQEAHLDSANLQKAVLDGANLQGAFLTGANLQEAALTGANLQGAKVWMEPETRWPDGFKLEEAGVVVVVEEE